MASKSALLPRGGPPRLLARAGRRRYEAPTCLFCSLAAPSTPAGPVRSRAPRSRRDVASPPRPRRWQSTAAPVASATPSNPRVELEHALLELQCRAPNLVNLSRLQLALQGLRQSAGQEVVRVAILGLANGGPTEGGGAVHTACRILRMLLVDPLSDEQPWEQELAAHDPSKPLIVRVAPGQRADVRVEISTDTALHELHVSSPDLNGLNLELLLMEVTAPYGAPGEVTVQSLEDAVLVPAVDIPSAEDRVSPVTTPVHQALLVADGFMGAVNVSALPVSEAGGSIMAAVQIEGVSKEQLDTDFDIVDISQAEQGIRLFRQSPEHAMDYERLWSTSNVPALASWLRAGARSTGEHATKPAVRQLIASLLQNTISSIHAADAQKLSRALAANGASPALVGLHGRLADWAQRAHAELQDELDLAFTGRRWRKLGWWKLFWRVDDVAMLTNEMLGQRFMPTAEQELVYLTGRIAELAGDSPQYPQPVSAGDADGAVPSEQRRLGSGERAPALAATSSSALPKWPGHIAFTRRYLQNETVPALQSLAQRLVMQALGTSGVTTSLAALLYASSFASTLYEAGAVAALGIVYSLGRMQKKWEAARGFWEGEVREEGRKAVRGAEESVAMVLDNGAAAKASEQEAQELQSARELVAKAEDALSRIQ
ncbi:serine threonine protein phosphatase 2b catalytic subunit protein [Purpureocillium lilacinum]|uniref:Serine threonine protein phosphatase 2b catalytic subunit protein n=1 Tax=Purpureocillium lilacinum TaxID=33203 RepID=A0A179GH10_PURLI|nr:serine threonine protein phosphatase 2b catalytic subunit protein [Purpureocillium lilacinum]